MKKIIISVYVDSIFYREEFSENEIEEAVDFVKLAGEQFEEKVDLPAAQHLIVHEA